MRNLFTVDWADALGRLHPVLLHLPIGLLIALVWMRIWKVQAVAVERSLLLLLALSAVGAATTGWLLHESASYGDPVELHEWLGISLMFLCLGLHWVHRKRPQWYAGTLYLGIGLLLPTAHLGASLTHGDDFLTQPWVEPEAQPEIKAPQTDPAIVAFSEVLPILEEYCVRCHGPRKQKGDLALHTLAHLMAGGESGPVLNAMDLNRSSLLHRMQLPLADEDHMPPENKPQPSQGEFDALRTWVLSARTLTDSQTQAGTAPIGTSLHSGPFPAESPPEVADGFRSADLQSTGLALETTSGSATPAPLDAPQIVQAVGSLQSAGVHVERIAPNKDELWVDWNSGQTPPATLLPPLNSLRDHIVHLALPGQALTSEVLQTIGTFPNLRVLDLRRGQVVEAGLDLAPLAPLNKLETLNITGTPILPESERVLTLLPSLKVAYLYGARVDIETIDIMQLDRGIQVTHSIAAPNTPIETEPKVQFESFQDPNAEPADSTGGAPNLVAINTTCPLTGKPISSSFLIVFEQRVIGFCCAQCVADFLEDPGGYKSQLPTKD